MLGNGSPASLCFRTNTTCNVLLQELQKLWDDIGESDAEKDRMLMDLEEECLQIYRRKVDEAANSKAQLHQSVVTIEAEIASLMASLGVLNIHSPFKANKGSKSLKENLAFVTPMLEDLKLQKDERMKQFVDIKAQIEKMSGEISGYSNQMDTAMLGSLTLDEQELTLRKLNEYQTHLRSLQKEKSDRLNKVLDYVNEVHTLCGVLGVDFGQTVSEVHPSLHRTNHELSTNISDDTLDGLQRMIQKLKTERKVRFQKLKDVMRLLSELWNLMDTPQEERNEFARAIDVVRSSESDVTDPDILSTETIEKVSAEVDKFNKLKSSRMKELVMKRRSELEILCKLAHIETDISTSLEKSTALIDFGLVDPSELLANIELHINKIKDEAQSRKEIIDKIDRWLSACEEENWLEEYNQDENRYSAGRGGHVNLKHAERARVTVNKIPSMVDNLIKKTVLWEEETQKSFLYDGVRLVSILEDYKLTRKQQEEEKKLHREQKKMQDLIVKRRESIYGSKPKPRRSNSVKRPNGYSGNVSMPPTPRRNSAGAANTDIMTPRSCSSNHQNGYFKEVRRLSTGPLNFVALPKNDSVSTYTSVCGSEPDSPLHTESHMQRT